MTKTKKILAIFVLLVGIFSISITKVHAATGTATMTASSSTVVVGNTVTFTVKVSSSSALGTFLYNLSYDSSLLSLTSGDSSGAPVFTGSEKSKTYTFKFKAKKAGTATVKFNISGGYTFSEEILTLSSPSKSVKIITQAELEASYSSNNNLSSLGVEGYNLSPSFSASVTSYTVNLPANTEEITVTGKKADSTASVSGLGTYYVEDGSNTIKVSVTAQNGSTKTYTIIAIVEELDPIKVTIDDKEYTVVRKSKLLSAPSSDFQEATITIDDNEVPTLFNEKANMTLVGLKDSEGNIELYIYDEESNTYTKYNQYTFSGLTLYIEDKEVANYDQKEEITIDDSKKIAYTFKDDSFYYFYAINLETGKENIYRYDKDENTVQKYTFKEKETSNPVVSAETDEKTYQYIIIGLLGFIFLTYIIILISLLFRGKKKSKKTKVMEKIKIEETPSEQLTEEEQAIHEEIERIGTQELNLKNLQDIEDNKITDSEKEKLIKDSEEELQRINNATTSETNEIADSLNETLKKEGSKKKKGTKKKNKKNETA